MTNPIGIWIGCVVVLGTALGWRAVLLVAGASVLLAAIRGKSQAPIIALLVLATSLGAWRSTSISTPDLTSPLWTSDGAELVVIGFPRTSAYSSQVLARVTRLRVDDNWSESDPIRVYLRLEKESKLAPGAHVRVSWKAEPLESVSPGYARWIRSQGAQATAVVWSSDEFNPSPKVLAWMVDLRSRISVNLQKAIHGDAGALAAGIVTGDDSALSESATNAFRQTGTSHITAVSGSNVAVVLAIWYAAVPPGKLRRHRVIRTVIVFSIWAYAVMVGFEPPAVRAALMTTLALVGVRSGRRPDPMTLLAISSAMIALAFPAYISQVSFWLSVIATAAIISCVSTGHDRSRTALTRDLIIGIIMAQVCTMPISILIFGSWSLSGVIANLVLTPLMALAFPLCFVLAVFSVIAQPVATVLAPIVEIPLRLALTCISTLSESSGVVSLAGAGWSSAIAVVIPCLIIAGALSRDVHRWLNRIVVAAD